MLNYTSIIFVSMYHIIALYGILNYTPTKFDIFLTLFMYAFTGFGITMGYHRLWAHKSYKASNILKIILAFAGAGASEGSIIWWSRLHRLHHNKSDTKNDPYGPQKGFLYSHILWIFENRNLPKLKNIKIDDLLNDSIVKFQHKYYVLMSLSCSIFLPLIIYKFQNLYHCLFFPISLARLLVWHSTWFVNSLEPQRRRRPQPGRPRPRPRSRRTRRRPLGRGRRPSGKCAIAARSAASRRASDARSMRARRARAVQLLMPPLMAA